MSTIIDSTHGVWVDGRPADDRAWEAWGEWYRPGWEARKAGQSRTPPRDWTGYATAAWMRGWDDADHDERYP